MKNDVISILTLYGLIPVIVLDDIDSALPLADAFEDAGLPVIEITLRTEVGLRAIEKIHEEKPEFIVGAGTVLTIEQCKKAVKAGATFIVSPGFNESLVKWCLEHDICVIPGCITPTEIEKALSYGIKTLKFFPASIYGGVKACSALYKPYKSVGIKFIPTGGINIDNLDEYSDKPFIAAIGGGWLYDKKAIASSNFDSIKETVKASINKLLGFKIAHARINVCSNVRECITQELGAVFGLTVKEENCSNFIGSNLELISPQGRGKNRHIAIRTNCIDRALFYLGNKGLLCDYTTAEYKNGRLNSICLEKEFGGVAIHLLQREGD